MDKEIHNGLPGYCVKCDNYLYDGHSNKCPHKPKTKKAYWFRAMYIGYKDKRFKYNGDGVHVVPFPEWCEKNKKALDNVVCE